MLARTQHVPNIARSAKTVLHTCCDVSDAALAECRERFGARHTTKDFREAVRDPEVDMICLAATERLRLPVIEAAAAAGKPVYVEKPLAKTLEEMYRIRGIVRQARIPFCVGHNRRSAPAMIEAHRLFRAHMTAPAPCPWRWDREGANRPGVPGEGTAGMAVRINDDHWSWKANAYAEDVREYGPMLFEMTHFTDICNWFLAAEPLDVAALESGLLNSGVVIRYATGEVATIHLCANGTFGYMKELYEAMGNGGLVAVDHLLEVRTAGLEGARPRITFPMLGDRHPDVGREGGVSGWLAKKRAACAEAAAKGDNRLVLAAEPDKGHARALDRFVDEIRGDGPVVCGVDDAVAATRVAFAAVKSARERRMVPLAEV